MLWIRQFHPISRYGILRINSAGTPPPSDPVEEQEPAEPGQPDKEIQFQEFGNAFNGANGVISMSTGYGSISQMQVETELDLKVGTLDGNLNNTKDGINATEGSGITASFEANAGDIVSFTYEFGTNDYIPYQDFSFYSINGKAESLAVVGVDTPNYGSTSGVFNYTVTNEDILNAKGQNIEFSVGIMDALDTVVDSYIKISDFKVAGFESELDDIDGTDYLMAQMLIWHLNRQMSTRTSNSPITVERH